MSSSLGDRTDPPSLDTLYDRVLSHFKDELNGRPSIEQMFILIDGVLPFEACLYYQVLPLYLEGSRLHLGMVNTQEATAIDYVRRIVSYHNYSLVPRSITSEALQAALSGYLNYAGGQAALQQRPLISGSRNSRHSGRARAEQHIDPATQKTLVVDSPEDLNDARYSSAAKAQIPTPPPEIPFIPNEATPPQTFQFSEALPPLAAKLRSRLEQSDAPVQQPVIPPLLSSIPRLELRANHLSSPIESLATLPPSELLQEMLARVLHGGIGRLYFERQAQGGRILWSQNGVLQSVLESLNPDVFQGIINELKLLVGLPLLPTQKPRQIEIERVYRQTRLLLRLKLIPSEQGEEATLQVLRGAALRFYQQQQLNKLERDALQIAKQLQTKINEIRDRATSEPGLVGARLEALPALTELLKHIERQLNALGVDPNS